MKPSLSKTLTLALAATLTLTACSQEPTSETTLPENTITTVEPTPTTAPEAQPENTTQSDNNTTEPETKDSQTPTPTKPAPIITSNGITIQTDIPYTTTAETANGPRTLTLDLYSPADANGNALVKNQPAVLLIHGGAFLAGNKNLTHMETWATQLAENGYVVATINYRLLLSNPTITNRTLANHLNNADPTAALPTQAPPEAIPTIRIGLAAAIEDANTALTWLTQQGVNPNQIAIGGESAGAITALHLAYLNDTLKLNPITPAAIINIYGAMSQPINGGTEIGNGEPPLWTLHGTNDLVVPYTAAEYLNQQTRTANIPHTLHTATDKAHGITSVGLFTGTTENGTPYMEDQIAFLKTHLNK